MTGVSIFLLGTVALTNVGFLLYLMRDNNQKASPPQAKPPEQPQPTEAETAKEPPTPQATVGKSKFRIEEFDERFEEIEQRFDRVIQMLDRIEGDVRLKDVEFANTEDAPTQEEIARDAEAVDNTPKDSRMTREQEKAAFTDVRIEDVEPETVSPPSASGATLDDIEKSMETAANPDATPEEKAKAGRVLITLTDTNFMEHFSDDANILQNVMRCCRESCRLDIADKTGKNPVSITRRKTTIEIAKNIDDFNPADLLKK